MTIFFPNDWTELKKCEFAFQFEDNFRFVVKCHDNRDVEIYVLTNKRFT